MSNGQSKIESVEEANERHVEFYRGMNRMQILYLRQFGEMVGVIEHG